MIFDLDCRENCWTQSTSVQSVAGVWSGKMGRGPGSPFGLDDKAPGCLNLEGLQTLRIPTNKKLEVWTQYRLLLSFLGDYFSSFKNKIMRQREICYKKILKSHKPAVESFYTSRTALMQPSFSGLFVTWAYFPIIRWKEENSLTANYKNNEKKWYTICK